MNRDYKGKKVTVVGLGVSGFAAARLLASRQAEVSVTECKHDPALEERAATLKKEGIEAETGRHTKGFIKERDLVIVSPGIDNGAPPLSWARKEGIPVIGEIELAGSLCPAAIIAVTGTNGKTTVTTLIGRILNEGGREAVVCGNIGNPFSGEIPRIHAGHLVVLEVSSFQLETTKDFKPRVALILNITPDHLDRHRDMEAYSRAKARIFTNQDADDWTVLNNADPDVRALAGRTKARVEFFNRENSLAAMAVGSIFAISEECMRKTIDNFKGIEHRYEFAAVIDGVNFINDSKATNVDAALWALERCAGPVILIAGGRDKAGDFRRARGLVGEKVKGLVVVGEAGPKIKRALGDIVPAKEAGTIPDSVRLAKEMAQSGDTVLLSPMCASFDMFRNFEERGSVFKQAVKELGVG